MGVYVRVMCQLLVLTACLSSVAKYQQATKVIIINSEFIAGTVANT